MSDSCRKYVENELNLLKDRLENINNEIHSSNIELKTIDKNIKQNIYLILSIFSSSNFISNHMIHKPFFLHFRSPK